MEEIAAEIPGVRFVQTHRDLERVAGSLASLCYSMFAVTSTRVKATDLGLLAVKLMRWMAESCMQHRDRSDLPVADVQYRDLVADPVATVRQVYDEHDLEWSAAVERAVAEGANKRPQHQQGRHRYELADFGLTSAEVRAALASYQERFLGD